MHLGSAGGVVGEAVEVAVGQEGRGDERPGVGEVVGLGVGQGGDLVDLHDSDSTGEASVDLVLDK